MRLPSVAGLIVLAAALIAACGGSGDLTGEAEIPAGYTEFRGAGVSFAYPEGWTVSRRTDPDGSPTIQVRDPKEPENPTSLIQLTIIPDAGERFDSYLDQLRVVIETVNDAEIEAQDEVDVDGAARAVRQRISVPASEGDEAAASAAINVVTGDGDVIGLSALAPLREARELDPEVVIDSFRLQADDG